MGNRIQILDCTLRDGAYIVNSKFGTAAIKGIINKMQDANIEIVECGWLKDAPHQPGTSFFHLPQDVEPYIVSKKKNTAYVAMIDWDRYNLDNLPPYDGKSIDAIRVVFPCNKFREGIALGKVIKAKGYQVFFQAANTLGYSDDGLVELAEEINRAKPVSLSVVDTFGAMFSDDLQRIVAILDKHLDNDIKLGFHSHNNQQLSFALTMQFVEMLLKTDRKIIVDASLCGMGRGAGNATTELVANYLNRKQCGNYDMNVILDAIDMYMGEFIQNYEWGYSTPYFISGMYCAHVNNIAYLQQNHRTNAVDMRNIIGSLSESDRKKYDYDLLEQKYVDYSSKIVDDSQAICSLRNSFGEREILLVLPGKSVSCQKEKIQKYIAEKKPIVIGVNAIIDGYDYDYLFFSNSIRYDFAREIYGEKMGKIKKIITSNVKTQGDEDEIIVNFNLTIKRGWMHFDNSGIMCLRLLNRLNSSDVSLAGFDGFENEYSESYADLSLPHINPGTEWDELNNEINEMFVDFKKSTADCMNIRFITESLFNKGTEN
ncbi:MAG TPA: hypothetical protein DDY98_04020 [Ruminococcaceae bacterium]|nr:hypothetical protein [Oscillospiraceae bacterium]